MTRRTFALIGAASVATLLLQADPALADPPSHAPAWGYHDRDDHDWHDRDDRDRYWHDRDDHRDWDRGRDWDRDRDWDRGRYAYPRPVYYVPRLPRGHQMVYYRGLPHYYYRGTWYAPCHGRWAVITPPYGLVVAYRDHRW